jgi:hypothetical protein
VLGIWPGRFRAGARTGLYSLALPEPPVFRLPQRGGRESRPLRVTIPFAGEGQQKWSYGKGRGYARCKAGFPSSKEGTSSLSSFDRLASQNILRNRTLQCFTNAHSILKNGWMKCCA